MIQNNSSDEGSKYSVEISGSANPNLFHRMKKEEGSNGRADQHSYGEDVKSTPSSGDDMENPDQIYDDTVGLDGSSPAGRTRTNNSINSIAATTDREISREVSRRGKRKYSSRLPDIGFERQLPPPLPPRELYTVEFEGPDDPCIPYNWRLRKKSLQLMIYLLPNLMVSFMSSIYGPAMPMIQEEFHLGVTPAALGVSLFILGFAVGPVIWGPLSEVYGRIPPYVICQIAFICSSFAAASAPNVQTLMLSRFFGGSFGAGAIAILPAMISDEFTAETRGNIMSIYSVAVVTGPLASPILGGFIAYSYLGWRWTQYIIAIPACATAVLFVLAAKETYRPILLVERAEELRERTGIWGILADHENVSFSVREVCENNIVRPVKMLVTEPVLLILSVYVGYVYGIQYMCLEAFPIIFTGYENAGRGFHKGVKFLPYVGLLSGTFVAGLSNKLFFEPRFSRLVKKYQTDYLPEQRLIVMMAGAISFPIGIFWLCWSGAYPEQVHWIVPCIGASFVQYGIFQIFLGAINYITDVYISFAASANAANAFLRAGMAAAFPLFATQMFENLGIQWAGTLIGCLSVIALPFPFIFYKFGYSLRLRSPYAMKN